MKHLLALFAVLFSITASAEKSVKQKFHILPDSPGWVYYQKTKQTRLLIPEVEPLTETDRALADSIKAGERNLEWLVFMNEHRPDDDKLALTKPGDLKGIPIEEPSRYSDKTVETKLAELKEQMPAELKAVIFSNAAFPVDLPVDEETYVKWAKEVDKNYQTAVRWKGMQPWLGQLAMEQELDLRGWYWLSKKTENVESTLRSVDTLPAEKQAEIKTWLEQMCVNKDGLYAECSKQVANAIKNKKAYELYLRTLPAGNEIWNDYFGLHNPRKDFVWTKTNPLEMLIPFRDPQDNVILDFLKVNIEDEFKWNDWKMILNFTPKAAVHVEFQPGVTPHVLGLGGDTIVMDKNTPLTEWDVQWTIRHEFGHVLGFTDCYIEFYDSKEKVIINYQLDTTHLMCSRAGRMQEQIYDTLKTNYYKN